MSGPSFARTNGPIRTYSRKLVKKSTESVKENQQQTKAPTSFEEPSMTQILNMDNSMFFDLDSEILDSKKTLHFRWIQQCKYFYFVLAPATKQIKKRKSDEDPTIIQDKGDDEFKAPLPAKKARGQEKPGLDHSLEVTPSDENLSQTFLKSIANDSFLLTQSSDCIKDAQNTAEPSVSIITNPVTCSQYVQVTRLEEEEIQKEATENHNNSLQALFQNASQEDICFLNIEETNQEVQKEQTLSNSSGVKESPAEKKPAPESSKNILKVSEAPVTNEVKHTRPKLLPVSSSCFRELGPFFGLTKAHRDFILQTKNIKSLYDWQEECLSLRAIYDRTNLIYALPTSGGKTLVAEIAMFREILLRKRNVMFVLPYVSIVQEKVQDLMPFALKFGFAIEEYCAGKGSVPPMKRRNKNVIFICTIEKGQILYDSLCESRRLHEVGLIVVDELHMVGDEHRGYNLEMLLSKAVFNKHGKVQVIGMSATISNLREIGKFLRADIYTRDFRPVELKEYVKIGSEILSIDPSVKDLSQAFKVERSLETIYSQQLLKKDPDHLGVLLLEVSPKESSLVFCATKKNCESVAKLLCDLFPKEMKEHKKDEKNNLIESIKLDCNGRMCPILAKTIPFGIAYHHSGLTSDERKHLEEAYRLNIICVICCTSTLAAGVNLPAKRVIIRSPYVGHNFLTLTRYKQMVGRAGRAGKCETGESIMICNPKDHNKLTSLLCSKMDETISGFVQDNSGVLLQTVVLNLIGVKIAETIDALVCFFEHTLLYVQIYQTSSSLRELMVKSVKELMKKGALTFTSTSIGNRHASFTINMNNNDQPVYPDDLLAVSKIGKAAVNAGLSHEDARQIELDMNNTYNHLVLKKDLHLFYVIAPEDIVDSIYPDNKFLHNCFINLDETLRVTMRAIGISEGLVIRLISRPASVKPSEMLMMKRFFVALMLLQLWNGKDVYEVGQTFKVSRGIAFSLMTSASSRAYTLFKFCEMYDEFWVFKGFLENFSKRLAYCCSAELLPLMELPGVKIVSCILFIQSF
jgi:POLQ-like helicase